MLNDYSVYETLNQKEMDELRYIAETCDVRIRDENLNNRSKDELIRDIIKTGNYKLERIKAPQKQQTEKKEKLTLIQKVALIVGMVTGVTMLVIAILAFMHRTPPPPISRNELHILSGMQSHEGGSTIIFFDEQVMIDYTIGGFHFIDNSSIHPYWTYVINITNTNEVSVQIERVWVEVIDFNAVIEFSAIEIWGGAGGETPNQIYHVSLGTTAGTFNASYLGEGDYISLLRNRSEIRTSNYVTVASNGFQQLLLNIEFPNNVSGVYTFTVNVSYIVAGTRKAFQSNEYRYFATTTLPIQHRGFPASIANTGCFGDLVWRTLNNINSSVTQADAYEMFTRIVRPVDNTNISVDYSVRLNELSLDSQLLGFFGDSEHLTYVESNERFLVVQDNNYITFNFYENRMIQEIHILFACYYGDEFSLPNNLRLHFSDESYKDIELLGLYWAHRQGDYRVIRGHYFISLPIPTYSLMIELIEVPDKGTTYMDVTLRTW